MSDKKSRGAWGSRIGYILSTLGMAIGVGIALIAHSLRNKEI